MLGKEGTVKIMFLQFCSLVTEKLQTYEYVRKHLRNNYIYISILIQLDFFSLDEFKLNITESNFLAYSDIRITFFNLPSYS